MSFRHLITPIDLDQWPRRSHYEFFRAFDQPFFDVACRIDVTPIFASPQKERHGLFATLTHTVLAAANDTDALCLRFRGDEVYRVKCNHASFTVLGEGDLFNYATAIFHPDLGAFAERIKEASAQSRDQEGINLKDDRRPDLIYITCLPWLDFESIRHPMMGDDDDCTPRIAWGKVVPDGDGGFQTCLQLTIHHALADGVHAAVFFDALKQRIASFRT